MGVGGALIKWPNDVWAGDPIRKLSGILLDVGGSDAAVLGVGVNVYQDMGENPHATSLSTLLQDPGCRRLVSDHVQTGLREALLASICWELERLMALPTSSVIDEHARRDMLRGKLIRVHHKSREEADERDFDATATGIDPTSGMLLVRREGFPAPIALSGEEVSITPHSASQVQG